MKPNQKGWIISHGAAGESAYLPSGGTAAWLWRGQEMRTWALQSCEPSGNPSVQGAKGPRPGQLMQDQRSWRAPQSGSVSLESSHTELHQSPLPDLQEGLGAALRFEEMWKWVLALSSPLSVSRIPRSWASELEGNQAGFQTCLAGNENAACVLSVL